MIDSHPSCILKAMHWQQSRAVLEHEYITLKTDTNICFGTDECRTFTLYALHCTLQQLVFFHLPYSSHRSSLTCESIDDDQFILVYESILLRKPLASKSFKYQQPEVKDIYYISQDAQPSP